MKASVIIAYRREGRYRRLIKALENHFRHMKYGKKDFEILATSEGNKSSARNELARKSRGTYLLFFDDDVMIRENTIEELLKPFVMYPNVGVVGGVNQTFPNADKMEVMAGRLLSSSLATFKSSARYTPKGDIREATEAELQSCNIAFLRKAFLEAGGFPERVIPCEENVLINEIMELGYKAIYTPFSVVYHRRPKLFLEYASTIFDYGRGRGRMIRNYGYRGRPKMIGRPSVILFFGYILHYIAYISGVIWGLIKG